MGSAVRLALVSVELSSAPGSRISGPYNAGVPVWRVQMSGWAGAQALHADAGQAVAYKGMMDCFVRTLREEGFQALFKVWGKGVGCARGALYASLECVQTKRMQTLLCLQCMLLLLVLAERTVAAAGLLKLLQLLLCLDRRAVPFSNTVHTVRNAVR